MAMCRFDGKNERGGRAAMSDIVVILTGFMGSGKSTVGRVLAKRLDCRFIDLDAKIVATKGCSINEIFAREGEVSFRAIESRLLEQVLSSHEIQVIATGGGAVIAGENRVLMRKRGVVVNLRVSLTQVLKRLHGCSDRPLLAGDNADKRVEQLLNEREQFYADADIRIDTDGKSVEDVATEILERLEGLST